MNLFVARLLELPVLLLGWLVFVPLAFLMPKDPRLVIVIGREGGQFTDNAKYFCLQAWSGEAGRHYRICFLTRDARTWSELATLGLPVLRDPSLRAGWALLRAAAIVADTVDWVQHARFHLAFRANRVQLWHGVPLKMIELQHFAARLGRMGPLQRWVHLIDAAVRSRYPHYDLVLSPSAQITARAFARSFRAAHVIESGYPRNAVLAPGVRDRLGDGVWVNTGREAVRALQSKRAQGTRLVLYAPTFRTHGANPLDPGVVDWAGLDRFATAERLHIVLKLHPMLSGTGRLPALAHIEEYDARRDVYPLLPDFDLLITDYSSIYFDFLLLDRPIIFFAYDLEAYQQRERDLLFPYADVTPGLTARNQQELHAAIHTALAPAGDGCSDRRRALRSLAFDDPGPDLDRRLWARIGNLRGMDPDCAGR